MGLTPWRINVKTQINVNKIKTLYLNFIEELSIKKSELIGDLVTTEVMESSRPVRTQTIR